MVGRAVAYFVFSQALSCGAGLSYRFARATTRRHGIQKYPLAHAQMRTWSECSTFDTTQVDTLIIVVCLHHHVSVMNIARIAVLPRMVVQ